MTRVKKGNREYTVEDGEVARYLADGYDVIDARGNTLRVGNAVTFDGLVRENEELRRRVGQLTNSNASLASEKADLSASIAKLTENAEKAEKALETAQARIKELEEKAAKKNGATK